MNEERLKILKMLKDDRITMEEAELLLDALGEESVHKEDQRQDQRQEHESSDDRSSADRWSQAAERFFRGWKDTPGGAFNFDWKLNPSGFQSGLREAMKGFEQSMKELAGEFKNTGFPGGFKEFFGRSSGQATKSVRAATGGASKLAISNRWGDVRITGTTAQELTGTASVTAWGTDAESAEEIADSVEVSQYREDDTIVLRFELPPDTARTRFRVDLDLNVPTEMAVSLKAMSGDLALSELASGVSAVNLSGDIIVQRVHGIISVESKSGDVDILGCEGEIRAHSLSGDMSLEKVRSVMVRSHTVSGDISAAIVPDGQADIELQSTSGDVRLSVPPETGFEIAADTTSGDVTCALPVEYSEKSAGHLTGTLNGGGTKVRLQTKSGDIRIGATQ